MPPFPSYFFNMTWPFNWTDIDAAVATLSENPLQPVYYFMEMTGGPILWGSVFLGLGMFIGYLHTKSALGAGIAALFIGPIFTAIAELRVLGYVAIALGLAPVFKTLIKG